MKQIGLALHNYEGTRQALPPSSVTGGSADSSLREFTLTGTPSKTAQHCFLAIILPYLEQGNVLQQAGTPYDYHQDWYAAANRKAATSRIPTYECPSAPGDHTVTPPILPGSFGDLAYATTDYMATNRGNNRPAVWNAIFNNNPAYPGDTGIRGILGSNVFTPINAIPDGLSNTVMVSEAANRPARWVSGKLVEAQTSYMNGPWAYSGNDIAVDGANAAVCSNPSTASATLSAAANVPGAVSLNCTNQGEIYAFHTGGANVGMGDGSVRFLRDSVALSTLQLMVARGDGAPVPGD